MARRSRRWSDRTSRSRRSAEHGIEVFEEQLSCWRKRMRVRRQQMKQKKMMPQRLQDERALQQEAGASRRSHRSRYDDDLAELPLGFHPN